jgi:hypothetical protein
MLSFESLNQKDKLQPNVSADRRKSIKKSDVSGQSKRQDVLDTCD